MPQHTQRDISRRPSSPSPRFCCLPFFAFAGPRPPAVLRCMCGNSGSCISSVCLAVRRARPSPVHAHPPLTSRYHWRPAGACLVDPGSSRQLVVESHLAPLLSTNVVAASLSRLGCHSATPPREWARVGGSGDERQPTPLSNHPLADSFCPVAGAAIKLQQHSHLLAPLASSCAPPTCALSERKGKLLASALKLQTRPRSELL